MKKSTIKAILILIWTASTLSCLGQYSVRVDPMWKARELRELAMKGRNSDKIINSQDSTIVILETTIREKDAFHEAQMADEREKTAAAQAVAHKMTGFADSQKKENTYLQKELKKARRGKKIITYIALAAIGWAVVK